MTDVLTPRHAPRCHCAAGRGTDRHVHLNQAQIAAAWRAARPNRPPVRAYATARHDWRLHIVGPDVDPRGSGDGLPDALCGIRLDVLASPPSPRDERTVCPVCSARLRGVSS